MITSAKWMTFATLLRAVALAVPLALLSLGKAEETITREYDVKAAFLYNFSAFTEWPAAAFNTPTSPIVIGIMGRDPFGPSLDVMIHGERVKGHPLVVKRATRIADIYGCHILFISSSEAKQAGDILRRVKTEPILTVSDIPGFAESGGAVGFITAGSVQLKINPAALQAAHLAISAKLLRLAQLIERKGGTR